MGREKTPGDDSALSDLYQNIESRLKIIKEESETNVCIFCKTTSVSDLTLGPMYYHDGVVTHYFCMLFSAALSQNGADDDGILGFMPDDIMKEVRRSFRLKCIYCDMGGASVGCCNKKCREVFHFPCGLNNGANFQFHGMYESYCARHFKRPHMTTKLKKDWSCPICMSGIVKGQDPVIGTCCKAAVFHKECLQRMALSAGYFFKCPMCNSSKKFVQEMRHSGIYVPEQDASWEKDNAFQDLYVRYTKCDALKCSCAKGREFEAHKGNWMLARCRLCGAAAVHRQCGKLETVSNWACEPCLSVEVKADGDKKKEPKSRKAPSKTPLRREKPGPSAAVVHVSAVSANRRVRNGSVKRPSETRRGASPIFTLTKVKIDSSCFSYFPYTKEALKRKYSHATCLPDWRNMELQVNVCNWIPPLTKDISCLRKVPIPSPEGSAAGSSKQTQRGKKSGVYKRKPPLHRGDLKSILDAVDPVPVASVKSDKRVKKPSTKVPIPGSANNITPVKIPPVSPVIKKVPPIVLTATSPLNNSLPPPNCFTTTGRFLPSKRLAYESALKEPSIVPEKRFKIRTVVQEEYKKYDLSQLQIKKKKYNSKSSWSRGVVKKNKTQKGLKQKPESTTTEAPVELLKPQTDFPEEDVDDQKSINEVSESVLPVDASPDPFVELPSELNSVLDSEFYNTQEELEEFPKRQEPTPEEEQSFRDLGKRLRTELSRETAESGMSIRRRKQVFSNSAATTRVGEEPEIIKFVYAGKPPRVVSKKLEWRHEPGPLNSKNKDVGSKAKSTRSADARSRGSAALGKATGLSQDETACEAVKKLMDETENIYVSTKQSEVLTSKEGMEKVALGKLYSKTAVFIKEQEFSIAEDESSSTEENISVIFNSGDTKTNVMCPDSNVSSVITGSETASLDTTELQVGGISPLKSSQTSSGRFGRQINFTLNI